MRVLITKLEDAEQDLRVELLPFIRSMFKKFYEFRTFFCNTVSCIGELDCLCALSLVSSNKNMCRPKILSANKNPVLIIKKMRHPCI